LPARRRLVVQVAVVLLLAAVSCVAYINADHEKLLFDSVDYVRSKDSANLGHSIRQLFVAPLRPDEQLTHLSFALNSAVNRALGLPPLDVTGFLVFNVLVHALNVCLVYALVRSLLAAVEPRHAPRIGIPLALALLFAVHPLHASSVAYIAQRRGAMATTFYLLAVLAYLRARLSTTVLTQRQAAVRPNLSRDDLIPGRSPQTASAAGRWSWRRIACAAAIPVCYWLSYRCKSVGLTLPLTLLLIEFCLRAPQAPAMRRYLPWLVGGLVLCGAGVLFFLRRLGLIDPETLGIRPYGPAGLHGAWVHFLTEARVFVHYGKLLFLPLPAWMCVDHSFALSAHLLDKLAVAALAFHSAILIMAIKAARRGWTLAAMGVFWFYATLLPYAVVPQADVFVEYKTYLPSVGVVLILADLVRRFGSYLPIAPRAAVTVALAAVLLAATLRRNLVYQSPLNFWTDAVQKCPNHPRPRQNLAATLIGLGRLDEAIANGAEAVRLAPNYVEARVTLGVALAQRGRVEEAITQYREALKVDANSVDAHYNLGNLFLQSNRCPEAIREYGMAQMLAPHRLEVYIMCSNALCDQGRFDEAIVELRQALEVVQADHDPALVVSVHFNLANTLARQENLQDAIAEYNAALNLDPQHYKAYYGLGLALERQGRISDAILAYSAALAIKPDLTEVRRAIEAVQQNPNRLKEVESPSAGGADSSGR
jgi:tetratricopeptide (TPR) repeat protein